MKSKDRPFRHVCTNATGTSKISLAMTGKPPSSRFFCNRDPPIAYINHLNALSDSMTLRKWAYTVFIQFVCSQTSKNVILFMGSCDPRDTDLRDLRNQVIVLTLPLNYTSLFQPMHMDTIPALKATYKKELVKAVPSILTVRASLQEASKHMKPGTKDIDEGHNSHLLDVRDILLKCWDDMQPQSIARFWVRTYILPHRSSAELIGVYEKLPRSRSCTDIVVVQLVLVLASKRISVNASKNILRSIPT